VISNTPKENQEKKAIVPRSHSAPSSPKKIKTITPQAPSQPTPKPIVYDLPDQQKTNSAPLKRTHSVSSTQSEKKSVLDRLSYSADTRSPRSSHDSLENVRFQVKPSIKDRLAAADAPDDYRSSRSSSALSIIEFDTRTHERKEVRPQDAVSTASDETKEKQIFVEKGAIHVQLQNPFYAERSHSRPRSSHRQDVYDVDVDDGGYKRIRDRRERSPSPRRRDRSRSRSRDRDRRPARYSSSRDDPRYDRHR
jgi:hypothetical protein